MIIYLNDEVAFLKKENNSTTDLDTMNFDFNIGDTMTLNSLSGKISKAYSSIIENEIKSIYHELPLHFKDSYAEFCNEEDEFFPYEEAISNSSINILLNQNWQLEVKFDVINLKEKDSEIKLTDIQLTN